MKQSFTISLLCIFCFQCSIAQSSHKVNPVFPGLSTPSSRSVQSFIYNLTTFTDTYTELTGSTSLNNGEIWDDPVYIMPLAFPFILNGNPVTELEFYGVGSLLRAPTSDPLVDNYLFAFETDLIDRGTFGSTSLSPISYLVEGTPGSRIQKLEFKNAGSYNEMDFSGTVNMYINFQMWLLEGTNTIEFHFGPGFINDPDVFYGGEPGPLSGTVDYDETNDVITNPHFIIGPAANPALSANLNLVTGTPADGMVYRLAIIEPLAITVTGENATSFCNPNGSASASATGGIGPYTYLWSTGGTTSAINNLDAGTYSITVTDDDGTSAIDSVTITNVNPLTLTVTSTDETSVGANDGTAEAQVTDGLPPYNYQWDNGDTTALIVNLAPGVYHVIVTDASGCTAEESVIVNPFGCPELIIEAEVHNISCFGLHDGIISLSVLNGSGSYEYDCIQTGTTTPYIENLWPGTFDFIITDDITNCTVLGSYLITQPDSLILSAGSTNESLQNQNDGTAWAIPSGGTIPYSYTWSNGSTDSLIINLMPGIYDITVTDDHQCSAIQSVTITAGPCGILEAQIADATCFGDCNGSIDLSFINAVTPISFEWNTGDTLPFISDHCAGSYSVVATDSTGCTLVDTFFIQAPLELQANGGSSNETILLHDGTAWVTPTGGTPPYMYLWDNGGTDSLIVNLSPGEYLVTVTDAHGCETNEVIAVNAFACIPDVQWDIAGLSCFGDCDGAIFVSALSGTGPYSYQWSTGDTTNAIANLCTGLYSLDITDLGQNCLSHWDYLLPQPDSFFATVDQVIHLTDSTETAINISLSGGTPPYDYLWFGANGFTSAEEDISGIPPGLYSAVLFDANGCQFHMDSIEVLDLTTGIPPIPGWNLAVYPNPAFDKILIKGLDADEFQIHLLHSDGREIRHWNNSTTLEVQDVVPGLYFLKIISGKNSTVKPLFIAR